MIDSRNIADLHPCLARGANELIRRMLAFNYHVGISSTYRDNEKQNELYAQGRTAPGNIVTNAKGGQSIHNYRLAFDIFQNVKGKEWNDNAFWALAGKIWREMGGTWGGDWQGFVDKPHFEFTGGLSLSDLQKQKQLPASAKMPWETQPKPEEDEEEDEMRYNKLEEIPDWGKDAIKRLVNAGAFADTSKLDLSYDMVRQFVLLYKVGRL